MKVVAGTLALVALGVPAQGQAQMTCNFGELMRRVQDAVEGRMSVEELMANHDYENCDAVAREIDEQSCGGEHDHDNDYPVNSCGYHSWGADRDGWNKCPGRPYPEHSAPLRDTFADDAESCCESACRDASEPLPPWTQSEMEYIMQHCQPTFNDCFPDTWHNPFMDSYCDFTPSPCYHAIMNCSDYDTPARCASAGCQYMPDFEPTPDGEFRDACLPTEPLARAAYECYANKTQEWDAQYDGPREVTTDRFEECTARHAHHGGDMSCCVGGELPCDYPEFGIGSGRRLQDSFVAETSKRQLGHCCDADLFCQCMAGEDTCDFAQRETKECGHTSNSTQLPPYHGPLDGSACTAADAMIMKGNESQTPLTGDCMECLASQGEEGDWTLCVSPLLMVPPCPSDNPFQWPATCQPFAPELCCNCVFGDCPPECDDVPEECHGILACVVGEYSDSGMQPGPVCPQLHGASTGRP